MSQPKHAVSAGLLNRFQKREDGVYRIPGGDKPSIMIFLRDHGTKLEVRCVEKDHCFFQAWTDLGKKRIYFPFNPPKSHHFPPRMKNGERKLAAAVQRYILDAYQGNDLGGWAYPRKKEAPSVKESRQQGAPTLSASAAVG